MREPDTKGPQESINVTCPEQAHPERENGLMVARGWGGRGEWGVTTNVGGSFGSDGILQN